MTVTRLAFPALVLIFAVVIAALTFIDLSGPNTKKQQDLYYPNQHLVPTSIPKPVNEYNEELKTIFYKKITSAEYQAWRQLGGIPRGYQRFPEEQIIKNIRSEIARKVQSEEEITPARIPIVSSPNPLLDGDINKEEWSDALRIDLETKEEPTTLYLKSDGKNLFLACDVPGDKTDHGYDQCRFGFHVDTTHLISNERVHIRPGPKSVLGGIRQTSIKWKGEEPFDENERWKNYVVSDWQIYKKSRGVSGMYPHRQYEAMLDLEEIGLHVEVPFPAFFEVQVNSMRSSPYMGLLGSRSLPVWFVIN